MKIARGVTVTRAITAAKTAEVTAVVARLPEAEETSITLVTPDCGDSSEYGGGNMVASVAVPMVTVPMTEAITPTTEEAVIASVTAGHPILRR